MSHFEHFHVFYHSYFFFLIFSFATFSSVVLTSKQQSNLTVQMMGSIFYHLHGSGEGPLRQEPGGSPGGSPVYALCPALNK